MLASMCGRQARSSRKKQSLSRRTMASTPRRSAGARAVKAVRRETLAYGGGLALVCHVRGQSVGQSGDVFGRGSTSAPNVR